MVKNLISISLTDAAESIDIDQIITTRYRDRKIDDGTR